MTKDTAVRALSDDELDSVGGGSELVGEPMCVDHGQFSFLGLTFHFESCAYVTRD
jgi:hypothetical protein